MSKRRKRSQPPQQGRQQAQQLDKKIHVLVSHEQQEALTKWQNDFKKVLPKVVEARVVARRIFEEMVAAPQWQVMETERPANFPEPPEEKPWTVGHAKVNIIDEREGNEK